VIGLDLCPYAPAVRRQGRVRIAHTDAIEVGALLEVFCDEVRRLLETPAAEIETTLLVHPRVLAEFDDYNDFLDVADAALEALGAVGVLQVASFHPQYRFADSVAGDVADATNRSPWPTLQLLREASIAAVTQGEPDSARIYEANIARMRALGATGWEALKAACRRDAEAALAGDATG
jgi:hypothetical protein